MFGKHSTLIDCGVDWFTTTATTRNDSTLLLLKAEVISAEESREGFDLKPWRMAGYAGWRCGRVEYGWRDDGAIVRLSSGLAATYWWDVYEITGRCSRVDLQATIRLDGPVPPTIKKMHGKVKRFYKERKDGPRITLWSNNEGGCTLYLGSRQSDLYFRGYNKEAQSGDEFYRSCLRLELEVKHELCQSVLAHLLSCGNVQSGLLGVLSDYLTERGIPTFLSPDLPRSLNERLPLRTDDLTALRWLRSAVRPTVQRLLEKGLEVEVHDVLGLNQKAVECTHGMLESGLIRN